MYTISSYDLCQTDRGREEVGELLNVMASNIGSLTNPLRLSNTFTSVSQLQLSKGTIATYLDYRALHQNNNINTGALT